jgi:hypothetical protein
MGGGIGRIDDESSLFQMQVWKWRQSANDAESGGKVSADRTSWMRPSLAAER